MSAGFRDTKVFDVNSPITLLYGEVWRIWLVGLPETIRIYLLVFIVNLVEIQEVRNLDFLGST